MEIWANIKEVPGYMVSSLGRVRNRNTGRILQTELNRKGGYERVDIGGRKRYVHRLVMNSFFSECTDEKVTHIDGNKCNNAITNLKFIDKK